jgi:aryl-alcohol dehydrogenase-like predicted oxidoreductase
MRYKKLGRTGLLVSELCLGTMTFGDGGQWTQMGGLGQAGGDDLVKTAFDGGINFFDTADVYGNSRSERILGQAIRNVGLHRDEIVVATKGHGRIGGMGDDEGLNQAQKAEAARRRAVRNVNGNSRKHLLDAIDASLKRLQLDHVDLYQIHGVDPLTPLEETMDALNDIVRSGRARYVGVCNHQAWQVAKANGIAERRGFPRWESLQMFYSIGGRDIEREIVPLAQEENLAILPWSPLAGGFFSGKFQRDGKGPADARRATFDFPPVNKDKGFDIIDVLQRVGRAQDASVARTALAWTLHKPFVTSVIIGARTPAQLVDNLASTNLKLSAEAMKALDDVSALGVEYPGWMLARQGADRRGQVG